MSEVRHCFKIQPPNSYKNILKFQYIKISTLAMIAWSYPDIGEVEHQKIMEVIKSGWLSQGSITKQFEDALRETIGVNHAIVVNSGTSALIAALLAHEIGQRDEVIVPTYTFAATCNAVLSVGAKPVFADCDPHTFNVSQETIRKVITSKTKACLIVDVGGMPCDLDGIKKLLEKNNIILIEDAAQAFGAMYKDKRIGSFDHTTIFSFHMAKIITTVEGGCVVTNDDELANKLRLIRNHGMTRPYEHVNYGLNFRITDIQSAIGLAQLGKLSSFLKRRATISEIYKKNLKSVVDFQFVPDYVTLHPYFLFFILARTEAQRELIEAEFLRSRIDFRRCWKPLHLQPYYQKNVNSVHYPSAEDLYKRSLTLPIGNAMSLENANLVIDAVLRACLERDKVWETALGG
ncbi:MAG: DegT/DnrJ/EryC1/StrS family aminotransferase [Aigarchaeota archaeon]|nr:DegT/DnrJ/EryC1/StrS family aminotransferase [Aigarchaeota archaeon]MDW8092659.1 DegT/DnrJ/EryC1/StrS family aminotransferase [Nitrososphaerota archaeon]